MDRLRMPSDAELMKIAIKDLQNSSLSTEERQLALQELLVLVEPIDNAIDLNKLGGLVALVNELERDEEELRTTAAWVLGKASQNNPDVQKQILHLGVLPRLIHMVRSSYSEEAVRALYAVSALIRNFPFAQEEFYLEGGSVLLQEIMSNTSTDIRLRRKSLFLLTDLAEQQLEIGGKQNSHFADERLLKSAVDLMGSSDLDTQEKALMAVRSLARLNSMTLKKLRDLCQLEAALENLRAQLQHLMKSEEHAELAQDMELLRQEVMKIMSSDSSDIVEQ
ncbi:hypothetical protein O6H91_13G037900 [Diphasiastrum complanatum]|uniref:Uncharacterized protein n=3 Tax=Diphasiastrum complanatum TaxID=34168 RepID=A0ACC2BTX7_DIPCM|nr:hypothetical protein O6H91_13G037900 [Diphasiastrum complanatum]